MLSSVPDLVDEAGNIYSHSHALPNDARDESDRRIALALERAASQQSTGSCPYKDYLQSKKIRSNQEARKEILKKLKRLAEYTESLYDKNKKMMEKVGDDLPVWEFKPRPSRLLMFKTEVEGILPPCWIIVDAFYKPGGQQRVQQGAIDRAENIMHLYLTADPVQQ